MFAAMTSKESGKPVPIELAIASGLALGWSGQFGIFVLGAICWFILKKLKPTASSYLLLVASINLGTAIITCIAAATGMYSPSYLVEPMIVSILTIALLFSGWWAWAVVLVFHDGYVVIQRALDLHAPDLTAQTQRMLLGGLALRVFVIWMLICFLRELKKAKPGKVVATTQSNVEDAASSKNDSSEEPS